MCLINKKIYLRKELNPYELRTPLVPSDIKKLINSGYAIYVQSSCNRIFSDSEYENIGSKLTDLEWYNEKFKDHLIIGLKELDNLDKLSNHTHLYFSHSYKNQSGSENILNQFKKTKSKLYDFEYFLNSLNNRLISFGYYAGYVGGVLGLTQYFLKKNNLNLNNLSPFKSSNHLFNIIIDNNSQYNQKIHIGLIGPNGKTGQGVQYILKNFGLDYQPIYTNTPKTNLVQYDILYNCICLDTEQNETWFDTYTLFEKNIIIVDISCDYTKSNNPIKIYNSCTNWTNPVYKPNEYVDIISIDNLPSLLPLDSSVYFSNLLVDLLINPEYNYIWEKNLNIFESKIKNI
jgi:saccharopine dehydrogenase (NAD+, L-lysine-forming)